jgi:hypothetical protein
MPLFTLDTLQFSKRLTKAGLKKEIAEELSAAFKENQTESLENLATKQDLREVKLEINGLRQEINNLEHKLTVKIFVMLLIAVGVMNYLSKII